MNWHLTDLGDSEPYPAAPVSVSGCSCGRCPRTILLYKAKREKAEETRRKTVNWHNRWLYEEVTTNIHLFVFLPVSQHSSFLAASSGFVGVRMNITWTSDANKNLQLLIDFRHKINFNIKKGASVYAHICVTFHSM